MTLKINQSVSKDAQSRTLLKELLKVHQIHQAYNVRDLTDADEQILEKAFNTTREMMPRISATPACRRPRPLPQAGRSFR